MKISSGAQIPYILGTAFRIKKLMCFKPTFCDAVKQLIFITNGYNTLTATQ